MRAARRRRPRRAPRRGSRAAAPRSARGCRRAANDAAAHAELALLADREVLQVGAVEQLAPTARCRSRRAIVSGANSQQADDPRAVGRERLEPVQDHVVADEVEEHVRRQHQAVVAAAVLLRQAGQRRQARPAVEREAADALAVRRAVAGLVERSLAALELRQHGRQLGVDGRAVVALAEVLDDQLPVAGGLVRAPRAGDERRPCPSVAISSSDPIRVRIWRPMSSSHEPGSSAMLIHSAAEPLLESRLGCKPRFSSARGASRACSARPQRAVEAVRPGVVRAADDALADARRARSAGARRGAGRRCSTRAAGAVLGAQHDDALAADLADDEGARLGDVVARGRRTPTCAVDGALLGAKMAGSVYHQPSSEAGKVSWSVSAAIASALPSRRSLPAAALRPRPPSAGANPSASRRR